MSPLLLLLVGLSSSVNLGERPPGVVVAADLRMSRAALRAAFDTTPKITGGWSARTSGDLALWRGLEAGGEVVVRDGGVYRKTTLWARLGWRHGPIVVSGRLRVAGDPPASYGLLAIYTRPLGRLAFQTEQGLLLYQQPTVRAAYYCTVSLGVRLTP